MEILSQIARELIAGEEKQVDQLTRNAVAEGIPSQEILNQGLVAGMEVIGEQFGRHEIFLPDVLLAAKAMEVGLEILKPHLASARVPTLGRIVIGTVQGDLHDIGKNLVGIMLKGAGMDVIDLGKDVPPEKLVATAKDTGARVIGMSALLTTTMPAMKRVVELIAEEGLVQKIRTVVGGAPVTAEYASEIGADAYAYDAANAVAQISVLMR